MKKTRVVLLIGCAFAAGVVLGDRSWERIRLFEPVVIKPYTPTPDAIAHFRLVEIPPFSSDHYYFREGFTDIDEYWSFRLPPELAKVFVTAYVERTKLPLVKDTSGIPDFVLGHTQSEEWDNRYWFKGYDELDQIYYEKFLFCGYSVDRNRLYLMNWDE